MTEHISDAFEAIELRQAVRSFSSKKVSDKTLFQLLELAQRAPSAYNLHPWHFILVRDIEVKQLLFEIAMGQDQILSAPEIVVFVADPEAWKSHYEKVLQESVLSESMTEDYAIACRKNVNMLFSRDPFGMYGFLKRIIIPLRRLSRPIPHVIASRAQAVDYVRAQTMFAAATFMIAASGAGLATCPMESFDEERLKRLLAIPPRMTVPLIIPLGYPMDGEQVPRSYRVPLVERLSVDLFPNKLSKLKKKT